MHRTPASRLLPFVLAVAALLAGCTAAGTGGPSGSASTTDSPPTPTSRATPVGSQATSVAVETASPSAVAAGPPVARLAVEGGDPVAGQLGSYTWNGGGSDSPWLPGAAFTVGSGERLAASLDPDVGVAAWSARRVGAGTADGAGAVGLAEGAAPIAFDAPATGRWSIQLTVGFADELGSAVYYWDVTVR